MQEDFIQRLDYYNTKTIIIKFKINKKWGQ